MEKVMRRKCVRDMAAVAALLGIAATGPAFAGDARTGASNRTGATAGTSTNLNTGVDLNTDARNESQARGGALADTKSIRPGSPGSGSKAGTAATESGSGSGSTSAGEIGRAHV